MGSIFVTTNLAAAVASIATMCLTWIRYKKPDVSMTLKRFIGWLVAITAGCDLVSPLERQLSFDSRYCNSIAIEFFDKVLKIDDPVVQ
jgi:Amt family ammonium transporter